MDLMDATKAELLKSCVDNMIDADACVGLSRTDQEIIQGTSQIGISTFLVLLFGPVVLCGAVIAGSFNACSCQFDDKNCL